MKIGAELSNRADIGYLESAFCENKGGVWFLLNTVQVLSQDVSAISGHWQLHFSPMEESEGALSIFFYSLWS